MWGDVSSSQGHYVQFNMGYGTCFPIPTKFSHETIEVYECFVTITYLIFPLVQAVKKLGLWGLFTRGLPLRIVMIGTLTGAQWGIYDAFKVSVGL